ncbi:sirohydrochlorin chelatase [Streptomyces solincola]|uniref:Sirohydrochlorin chelatase n=1 Tax=Streptomyces solincola TaxID=2100817 RepID=A0A2S9PNM7_9ACTN|nr:sirohydrochlorin chelatase [Streptomyces solincola]PRH76048.1 sirohydrochlorin chelatase [Streptomyces solincola]
MDAATLDHAGAGPPWAAPAGRPPALVAVAHGSRDPRALPTVRALLDAVRALRPWLPVRLGHIELNEPLLDRALADPALAPDPETAPGPAAAHHESAPDAVRPPEAVPAPDAVLVPLLYGPGHHVRHDLPRAAARAPHLRVRTAEPLGGDPLLARALHGRLSEAGWRPGDAARPDTAVVLAAAGSRDPGSAAAVRRTARLLAARLGGGVPVVAAYASAAAPGVPEAVAALTARGRPRIAVASCFTAPGLFATRAAEAAPWLAAAPLGPHPALAELVLRRYDQALAAGPVVHPGDQRRQPACR